MRGREAPRRRARQQVTLPPLSGLDIHWGLNGSEFTSHVFGDTLRAWGAVQTRIFPGRPQTNGCVERVQGTILEECWKPAFARYVVPKVGGLMRELERYLDYYNTDRAHTGRWTRGRTPAEVIGAARLWTQQQ